MKLSFKAIVIKHQWIKRNHIGRFEKHLFSQSASKCASWFHLQYWLSRSCFYYDFARYWIFIL